MSGTPDIDLMIRDLRTGATSIEGEGYWPVDPQLLRDAAGELQRMQRRLNGAVRIEYINDVWTADDYQDDTP